MAETTKLTIIAQLRDELTGPLHKVKRQLDAVSRSAERSAESSKKQAHASDLAARAATRQSKAADKSAAAQDAQAKAMRALTRSVERTATRLDRVQITNTRATAATQKTTRATKAQTAAMDESARVATAQEAAFHRLAKANGWIVYSSGRVRDSQRKWVPVAQVAIAKNLAMSEALKDVRDETERVAVHTERLQEKLTGVTPRMMRAGVAVDSLARRFGVGAGQSRQFGVATVQALSSTIPAGRKAAAEHIRTIDRMVNHSRRGVKEINGALKGMYGGVALGVGALAGASLVGGMARINAFEAADVRLGVQGFDEGQREDIKNEVNEMVLGTTATLAEGMTFAQLLLGSGVDYETEFSDRMQTALNTSALYGDPNDPKRLAVVLGQIESKGYLTGEERNQLAELTVPIDKWIAQQKGIPQDQVLKAIESREVTADDMWEAMRDPVNGAADEMGKTFRGAFLMMVAAFSRSGEAFEMPLLDPLRTMMNNVTKLLNDAHPYFQELGEALAPGLQRTADLFPRFAAQLAPWGDALMTLMESLGDNLPFIVQGFVNWFMILSWGAVVLTEFMAILSDLAGPFLPILIPLLLGAAHALTGWFIISKIVKWTKQLFKLMPEGTKQTGLLARAWQVLTTSVRMFPGTWIVTAILAVIAVMGVLYDNVEWVRNAFDSVTDAIRDVIEWFDNLLGKADEWMAKKLGIENPEKSTIIQDVVSQFTTGGPSDAFFENNGIDPEAWIPEPFKRINQNFEQVVGWGDDKVHGQGALKFLGGDKDHVNPLLDNMSSADTHRNQLGDMGFDFKGFYSGGYTGDVPTTEVAGAVHGQEFVTNSWATRSLEASAPGGLAYANATGQWPTAASAAPSLTYAPSVQISVGDGTDEAAFREIVRAELARNAREVSRQYATPDRVGAH